MEVGQNVFRVFSNLQKRISKSLSQSATGVQFADVASQLHILANILSDRSFDLKPSPDGRASAANVLFYPETIPLVRADQDRTHTALVYRTAFLVSSRELEFHFNPSRPKLETDLAVLLSVHPVRQRLSSRFPAAHQIEETIAADLLNARKPLSSGQLRDNPLEALARILLGEDCLAKVDTKLGNWLQRASETQVDSGSALEREARELARILPYPVRESFEPPILWGLVAIDESIASSEVCGAADTARKTTTHEAKLRKSITRKQVELRKPNNPLFHSFEKTETVEDFEGEGTRAQASEDLEQEEEALQDLELGYVIRTNESTPGLLKGEIIGDGAEIFVAGPAAPAETSHCYAEWNWKTRSYRNDWCSLIEMRPNSASNSPPSQVHIRQRYRAEISEIRRQVVALLSQRFMRNRELDGPEIDVESIVDRHADLRAGHTPPDRLYVSEKRKFRDVAIMLLFDTSLSTDGWLDGRRVLDLELESILILAEVFEGLLDDEIAIANFNSNTRHQCRFSLLKDFGEPWQRLRTQVPFVEPAGYTRIGPALRHATKLLSKSHAREKFIILVTDGKPTDYDQYEGRYGREDVAQAIREAKHLSIQSFGLAIERETKQSLAQMFGAGHYRVLPRMAALPSAMAEIFVRLIS